MNTYESVLKHYGSVTKLAEMLGITIQAVYKWKGQIPRRAAFEIERDTKGKFNADKLCPRK